MEPGLIIFDCDGVLIDSEEIAIRLLVAALAETGVTMEPAAVTRQFLGRAFPAVTAHVREAFDLILPAGFEAGYRERLLTAYGSELRAMAGAAEALAAIRVPYCLATSSSPARLARSLEIAGLARFFDGRAFTASEVERGKPAPDLFLHAARRMGVPPARAAVLEDSAPGIAAGIAAGMQVWRFTGGSHMAAAAPLPPGLEPLGQVESFAALRRLWPGAFREPRRAARPPSAAGEAAPA